MSPRVVLAILLVVALTGCATVEPLPDVPKTVQVPVAVPCIEAGQIPRAVFSSDAELLALDAAPFVYALARDRLDRRNHISRLEAVLEACAAKTQ